MNKNERTSVISWIEESLQEEGFTEMKIEFEDTDKKEAGYAAELIFAKVTGTDKDKTHREVNIVVKMGKRSEALREKQPIMRECYKRELWFYEKVLPTFRKFQSNKNIVNTFDAVPKCYKTFLTDDMEVLVLDDLKTRGFKVHDCKNPLSLKHVRLVLENYAKFHAISFALRDQNVHEFNDSTADHFSLLRQMALTSNLFSKEDKGLKNLRKTGRDDLVVQYEKVINRSKEKILVEVLDDAVEEFVVTHGDCHMGNFMFKYEDNDYDCPVRVAIIDWQIFDIHSPVLDLSHFLYSTASKQDLSQLGELARFYHKHLARYLKELGSDVEKLFPYSALVEHWKKYSVYGFTLVTTFLELYFVDQENTQSFDELKNDSDMGGILSVVKLNNADLYNDRLISLVEHHCNYELT